MMDTERTPVPDEGPSSAESLTDADAAPESVAPRQPFSLAETDIYGFPRLDGADAEPYATPGSYNGARWSTYGPGAFEGGATAGGAAVAQARPGRVRTVFRETVETVLLALLIFISVRSVIQNFKVEGSSMEPNLHSGQYLLVNKAAYLGLDLSPVASLISAQTSTEPPVVYPFGAPNRGDVIVFRYPKDPRRDFIKRVIAVPGDKVEVRSGRVLVNDQMLNEPYIVENPAYSKEPTVVPPDHYYVLGDNRNNSSDSHVWGPVPREMIIGKAWLSYWPMSDWGLAPNYTVLAGQ